MGMITKKEVEKLEKDYKKKLKPGTKEDVKKAMQDIHGKYLDLVWYARSGNNIDHPVHGSAVIKSRAKTDQKYSDDTNELHKCDSNWQHGFNSGMLACVRYLWSIEELGKQLAKESFPELDT